MEKPKLLHKNYKMRVPPETGVFQILINKPSENYPGKFDFKGLGTGFFISKYGVFLTAKHVLEDTVYEIHGKKIPAIDFQNGKGLQAVPLVNGTGYGCLIRDVVLHPTADIAVGLAQPPVQADGTRYPGFAISVCALDSKQAEVGDKLHAFGYQRTALQENLEEDSVEINLNPRHYDGVVKAYHPNGFTSAKWPVYQISVPIPSGASGCPLTSLKTNGVIGVSCTSWCTADEDHEESTATDIRLAFDLPVPPNLVGFSGKTVLDLVKSEGLLV